jgi:hypothetical protein
LIRVVRTQFKTIQSLTALNLEYSIKINDLVLDKAKLSKRGE